jgi:hypothetical protein
VLPLCVESGPPGLMQCSLVRFMPPSFCLAFVTRIYDLVHLTGAF